MNEASQRTRRLVAKLERALLGAAMSAALWVVERRLSRSRPPEDARPGGP